MENTDLVQLLRELGRFCEDSTLEGAIDLAGRAYTAAAEEIERRREPTSEELFSLVEFELTHDYCETSAAYEKLMSSAVTAARAALAHFGGGEVQP